MPVENISVFKVRNLLLVTVPPDPDDETVSALQEKVLQAMARHESKGLVLDISTVQTLDSFFARTVTETVQMVALMGGQTVLAGMRPSVAITATELGLTVGNTLTALDVDRALTLLETESLLNVGQASSLPVYGASSPRVSGGRMPPEPADKMSAPHAQIGAEASKGRAV